jgi:hypothetical protein
MLRIRVRRLWREFRANLIVQLLAWIGGSSMFSAAGRAIWQVLHHNPADWEFLGLMFAIGLALVIAALWKKSESEPRSTHGDPIDVSRVNPANDDQVRRLNESHKEEIRKLEVSHNAYLSRAQESRRQCEEERRAAKEKLAIFSPLQMDALQLSHDLMNYLIRMGGPPAPKYSLEDIERMSLAESKRLIETADGDYEDSMYFYYGDTHSHPRSTNPDAVARAITVRMRRLVPFYDKVRAGFELEFAERVKQLSNRLTLNGMADDRLALPIDGRRSVANIRTIAAALWEVAYKLAERKVPLESAERA